VLLTRAMLIPYFASKNSIKVINFANAHLSFDWAYVVYFHKTTLPGIFLWKALPEDISLLMPNEKYLQMMQRLCETIFEKIIKLFFLHAHFCVHY
jgi:hypothetical protein